MTDTAEHQFIFARLREGYLRFVKGLVFTLAFISGVGLFVMVGTICADVVLRLPVINKPFMGAYDIVRIAGAITLSAAMPYTTAVKGHVAIEYFFHKLGRTGRIVVDSCMRLLSIALFGFLGWRSIEYGQEMYKNNQVSQTLQIPLFWLPWAIGFCCFVSLMVIGYQLICPEREVMKP